MLNFDQPETPAQSGQGESTPAPPRAGLGDFAQRVVVAVLITVVILAVVYLMWRGVNVLLLTFAGVLFAVFLSALSDWLSKRTGLSYLWSLVVVVVVLLLGTAALGGLLAN